ncbi:MAG: site-2 protease family protein [Candidatus Caldarchaeum sp.]|nr:site-2 protease family protein [Candidatus Caldarchaeum sp.]
MVELVNALAVLAVAWVGAFLIHRFLVRRLRPASAEAGAEQPQNDRLSVSLYPLLLIVRSRRVARPLDIITEKSPRLWDAVSRAAVATGLGLMAFAVYILSSNLSTYLFRPEQVGGQNIVIPLIIGVTIRLENLPYLFIAFAIVLITHEGLHGIIARREGLPVKSAGVFFVFIVPGGFVEPDEQAFKSADPGVRIRVAAVGSFANLIVGLLAVLAMFSFFVPQEAGLIAVQVEENSRIPVNEVLLSIDDVPVNSYTARTTLITISSVLRIKTLETEYVFETNPEVRGRDLPLGTIIRGLGVTQVDTYFQPRLQGVDPVSSYTFYRTLYWLQLVSIGVAVFNMLPIYMLDGSIVLRAMLERYVKNPKRVVGLVNAAAILCVALLVSNIAMTYSFFGFFQL